MIRIGTRGSPLALAQAEVVAAPLRAAGVPVTIVPIRTEGDRLAEARLDLVGGKGLFVREIEEWLLRGAVDVAVHSLKDLPAVTPDGLCLAAFPAREAAHDVLVTRDGGGLEDLPKGAVLGTSSPRRRAIALAVRDDLVVEPLRGNVDTRLRKLGAGVCDAIIVAAAGLRRLHLTPAHAQPLAVEVFVPAVGQGTLAIEVRADDRATLDAMAALDHPATRRAALAERAFLQRLGGSCTTPLAAHATLPTAHTIRMDAVVASEDGRRVLRAAETASASEPEALGRRVAEMLLARGAASVTALAPGGR
ncbi:MAG TPA: hydroxymethylbilane synthase [Methylomirabilota bacterium]